MSYQVIARKWRPQTFSDLVGQSHVTSTLANAIKNDRVAHAYIFSGARGVGKTTAARILAKAMNCVKGPTAEPCGECDSCKEIAAGTSLDVIEIDAASNRGIDQIRELREMVRYAPAASRSKVVILDEAHMLTGEASNALLKTLEEPPDRVIFVMATTRAGKSRGYDSFAFAAFSFSRADLRGNHWPAGRNRQKRKSKDRAGRAGRDCAHGRRQPARCSLPARAGASLLRRRHCGQRGSRTCWAWCPEDSLNELVAAIAEGSADRALGLVHTFQKEGRNLQHFCREAIRHMRNLLIARVSGADSDLIAATADQRPALAKAAAQFSEEDLTRFFQILLQTDDDLRRKPDARVHLEMGLLRLINAQRLAPMEELLAELRSGAPAGVASAGGMRLSASAAPAVAAPQAAPATRSFSSAPAPQTTFTPPPRISAPSFSPVAAAAAPARAEIKAAPEPAREEIKTAQPAAPPATVALASESESEAEEVVAMPRRGAQKESRRSKLRKSKPRFRRSRNFSAKS